MNRIRALREEADMSQRELGIPARSKAGCHFQVRK